MRTPSQPGPQPGETRRSEPDGTRLRLHVGCNETHLDGFVNVDVRATSAADLVHSCKDLSPFADGSVELVFANAFFEHLYALERVPFLRDVHRVLAEGGALYLAAIPDFEGMARAYLERRPGHVSPRFDLDEVYRYTHGNPEQEPAWWLEQLHKTLFDAEKVVTLLAQAGFRDWFVFRYAWGNEPNAVNMGAIAQKPGGSALDDTALSALIDRSLPYTKVNRDTVQVLASTFR